MMHLPILAILLCQSATAPPATTKTVSPVPGQVTVVKAETKPMKDPDPNYLLGVRRIYVDSFGDDVISKEIQSMVVTALVKTKRFMVTENKEKADAILKGVALEKTSQEVHAYGEATTVAGAAGGHSSQASGSGGSFQSSSGGGFSAHHLATDDSSLNTETINDARVAVRLVTPDGDVIWTSTQESKGAKYVGASTDVAEKCIKQLMREVEKLEAANGTAKPAPIVQDSKGALSK